MPKLIQCPSCKRTFDTLNGMHVHHKFIHGKSLAKKMFICDYCKKAFKRRPSQVKGKYKFCSRECQGKWQSENVRGRKHPSWNRQKVRCDNCGREIAIIPSKLKLYNHHFCSSQCKHKWQSRNQTGKNNHNWKGGKVTVKCDLCGKEIHLYPSKAKRNSHHFCSLQCRNEWRSRNIRGEKHPSWNSEKVLCDFCGKEMTRQQCRIEQYKHQFCSRECVAQWVSENQSGERHPNWKGGLQKVECSNCGRELKRELSQVEKQEWFFCSYECKSEFESRQFSGENSPNWRGGKSFEPYPAEFNERLKEKVRERDNRICQYCGVEENIVGGKKIKMVVHHIDGDKTNNSMENLVTVCSGCNSHLESFVVRPQFEVPTIA